MPFSMDTPAAFVYNFGYLHDYIYMQQSRNIILRFLIFACSVGSSKIQSDGLWSLAPARSYVCRGFVCSGKNDEISNFMEPGNTA